jgi:serine/threonine-protein kinase
VCHLNALGTLELTGLDWAEGRAILAQPKRIGILLYLAVAQPPGWHRRDTLLGLLWRDLDEQHARNALSQALHHLRRGLGSDTLPSAGTDLVQVDSDHLACDAIEFEVLARAGKSAEALALYQGDLAPGFYVADSPEFEHWLDAERRRLRALAFQTALNLAATSEKIGDTATTAWALRRAVALHPEDEGTVRRLMLLLERTGDRASALRVYEELADGLRQELEVAPSRETQALELRLRETTAPASHATPRATIPASVAIPGPATRPPDSASRVAPKPRPRRGVLLVAALLVVGLVGVTGGEHLLSGWREASGASSSGLLVVAPFRLTGADPSLAYLREGMVDLLAAKLSGVVGPRAADPRLVLAAWRAAGSGQALDLTPEDARLVSERLGAERLILGSVVGRADHLVISASLHTVKGDGERARASVEGPADSLPALVDHLAAQLLLGDSREPLPRLQELASRSFPALQAFLAGRRAYRAGSYPEAAEHFQDALHHDSAFALAALHLADAMDWVGGEADAVAKRRAWEMRSRLAPMEQVYLDALLGPGFPQPASARQRIRAWESVVGLMPDRAEAWYGLGDILHHQGRVANEPEAKARSSEAFQRAAGMDPGYAAPLAHLADQAFVRDDLAEGRRLVARYLALDSVSDVACYFRWRLAVALGDSAGTGAARARFATDPPLTLFRIAVGSQLDGVAIADGRRAAHVLLARAVTQDEFARAQRLNWLIAANAGRFREFDQMLAGVATPPGMLGLLVATFWDGAPAGRRSPPILYTRFIRVAGGLWNGEAIPPDDVAELRSDLLRAHQSWTAEPVIELDALTTCREAGPETPAAVQRLDSLVSAGPPDSDWYIYRSLLLARCLEWRGDTAGALAMMRRRAYGAWSGLPYLATFFKEEGRLALATGDTSGARVAWRRYLGLRADPDPVAVPERDRIRRLLDGIVTTPTR